MDIIALNKQMTCPKSKAQIVAHIIDTGVNPVGPLAGRVEVVKYADTPGDGRTLSGGKAYNYADNYGDHGHGTGVAYHASLGIENMRIRSYNNQVDTTIKCLSAVLEYVKAHPEEKHLVNMSFKSGGSDELHDLIKQLVAFNVAVVVAAGNDGREAIDIYPSCYQEPITVAAIKNDGTKAIFSVWHNEVDFADIGVSIPTLTKDGDMVNMSGTSFSTPIVLNKLAKIWLGNPALTEAELYEQAKKNCLDLGAGGRDEYFGWGWIQSVNANKQETDDGDEVPDLSPVAEFIKYLNEQIGSAYVWGAQGHLIDFSNGKVTRNDKLINNDYTKWVKSAETSTENAERALEFIAKRKAAGVKTLSCYDCSGLSIFWFLDKKKLIPKDLSSDTIYSSCTPLNRSDLKPGDFVFRAYDSGKIHHIGYVTKVENGAITVVEAYGRDLGVVSRDINASGENYWNRYGRCPLLQSDEPKQDDDTEQKPISTDPFYATCSGAKVNIRSTPGVADTNILTQAVKDTLMLAMPAVDGWCAVLAFINNKPISGYMSEKYVKAT